MTEIMVIHRCVEIGCKCANRAGVIVYRGTDEAEAAFWLGNAPSGHEAIKETRPKRRKAIKY